MNKLRKELESYLDNNNVQAFLRVIREGETNQTPDAYKMLYGGKLFTSFADHPRIAIKSKWGWTSAAGAYQAMCAVPGKTKVDTWGDFVRACGPSEFYPMDQDVFAIWCINRRKALPDVLAGRFNEAIRRCSKEWASFPGAGYDQPTKRLETLRRTWEKYGGKEIGSETQQPEATQTEVTMPAPLALIAAQAFLPKLVELIPSMSQLFGSGSEVQKRNVAALHTVASAVLETTKEPNLQSAIEKMESEPAVVQEVREVVDPIVYGIVEAGGGGIEGARKAAYAPQPNQTNNPAIWFMGVFTPLVYMVAWAVLTGNFSNDAKMMVITAILGGLLASGTAFFLGSSYGSQKKDDRTRSTDQPRQ